MSREIFCGSGGALSGVMMSSGSSDPGREDHRLYQKACIIWAFTLYGGSISQDIICSFHSDLSFGNLVNPSTDTKSLEDPMIGSSNKSNQFPESICSQ